MNDLPNNFPDCDQGAIFGVGRIHRYVLWRRWGFETNRICTFVGLNPSTADETQDDPTIRRCIRFSKEWGFDAYVMLNAYGFRATDPRDMKAAVDPVGPENDRYIAAVAAVSDCVVAAWGTHCRAERQTEICRLMQRDVYCLGRTKAGFPKHPLYLRADTERELFAVGEVMRWS